MNIYVEINVDIPSQKEQTCAVLKCQILKDNFLDVIKVCTNVTFPLIYYHYSLFFTKQIQITQSARILLMIWPFMLMQKWVEN